ncbi:hypothetical protein [Specibacter sp. NPDC078692]|uniref:DUF7340 domain-containing protein n=1 Tax=Specibacter sp. NPDC078692 TaxID=3155818 RepID=UPI0034492263
MNTLTRVTAHRIVVVGPDGGEVGKFVHQAPLIGQLRVALRPSLEAKNGGGSGGGDGGSAAPMSLDAHDLLEEIDEEATRQWWIFKSVTRETGKPVPGQKPRPQTQQLPVELRVQFWAARAHLIAGGVDEAVKTMRGWIRSIESLFDPVHRKELAGTCPECDARFVWVEKDGEMVRVPALTAAWSAGGGAVASCAGCEQRWAGFDMHALAEHVNPVLSELVVNPG